MCQEVRSAAERDQGGKGELGFPDQVRGAWREAQTRVRACARVQVGERTCVHPREPGIGPAVLSPQGPSRQYRGKCSWRREMFCLTSGKLALPRVHKNDTRPVRSPNQLLQELLVGGRERTSGTWRELHCCFQPPAEACL